MASTLGLGGTSSGASTSASASTSDDPLLEERRQGLEQYLRAIVASPQDRWREAEAFRDFVELPRRESAKSLMPAGDGSVHDGGSNAGLSSKGGIGHRYVPGSYSASTAQNTTRTLGSPPAHQPAVETPQTLQQSSSQLYASQQAQFDRQDAALDDLTAVLRRQRQMGMAINQELTEQTELLDGLDEEVRATQGRLTKNERDIKRLG